LSKFKVPVALMCLANERVTGVSLTTTGLAATVRARVSKATKDWPTNMLKLVGAGVGAKRAGESWRELERRCSSDDPSYTSPSCA
jgi:hypothetical protein